ncbi:MAG: glycosyltransferase, partial [Holophagales bacterium]|nr:glycosyltransferase [Holophagales bacterium]
MTEKEKETPVSRPRVSVVVTTFDEEHNIAACLDSLLWGDEILVVDSFSNDRTPEIVREYEERHEGLRLVQR